MQYSAKGILSFWFFHFSTGFTTFKITTPLLLLFFTNKQESYNKKLEHKTLCSSSD